MTAETELISVIMPTYNRASMIKRAVESVITQDHSGLEIVIVDDASRDDTQKVVESIRDPRVIYIRRSENKGASAARNTGIHRAKGDYIAFLDSDDEFAPGKIRRQLQLFKELSPRPGLVFTNYLEAGQKQRLSIGKSVPSGYADTSKVFPAFPFCNPPSCWMLSRACLEETGLFDEKLWTMEDLDYFSRVVKKYPAYFLNEPLMIKHVHTCKKGSVPDKYAQETGERILEKWFPEMRRDKRFLVRFYCMMAKDMTRSGKKREAGKYLRKAFFIDPLNLKVLLKLTRTYFSYR